MRAVTVLQGGPLDGLDIPTDPYGGPSQWALNQAGELARFGEALIGRVEYDRRGRWVRTVYFDTPME